MEVGLMAELSISDSLDDNGWLEIGVDNKHGYGCEHIEKHDAVKIIAHLTKVFELKAPEIPGFEGTRDSLDKLTIRSE